MLLWHNPPSTGSNQTLGHCVVAGCIGAVWMSVDHRGVIAIGRSGKERDTWRFIAMFVMSRTLPGMLLRVRREYVCFVNCNSRLVVGLGADMMGGASVIRASVGSCEGMLFAGSPSLSITLCLGTLCLGTLCSWGGTYGTCCRSLCGRIHLCLGCMRLCLGLWMCPADNFFATSISTRVCFSGGISCNVVTSLSITSCRCLFHIKKGTWQCCGNNLSEPEIQ